MPRTWLSSLEDEARRVLPAHIFEYYRQGAGASLVADTAAAAWARYRVVPRVLRDVRNVDVTTEFLGTPAALPVGVAPTTLQRAADPDGEVAMARGCVAADVPLVVSSNAGESFARIAATGVTWWLQAYVTEDRALSVPLLEAGVAAGARAVVLTVDTPVVATKYDGGGPSALDQVPPDWVRTNLGDAAAAPKARDLLPADIGWVGDLTGLPVVVKGVLHPDDASAAVGAGAAAVWVSNHGGRQLDRAAATAACLGAVTTAVDRQVPVYVDGGIRTGVDVLGAVALGADGIFLGRPPLYALAIDGADGVRRALGDLAAEFVEALRTAGCADLDDARNLETTCS